jgi:hypothetical protein
MNSLVYIMFSKLHRCYRFSLHNVEDKEYIVSLLVYRNHNLYIVLYRRLKYLPYNRPIGRLIALFLPFFFYNTLLI